MLGFQASDFIVSDSRGASSFIRCEDRYHHSLALRRDDVVLRRPPVLPMKSLDHVLRGRTKALYKGISIPSDIVNHSASTSIAFYMYEPAHGPRIELCDGTASSPRRSTRRTGPGACPPTRATSTCGAPAADDWGRF